LAPESPTAASWTRARFSNLQRAASTGAVAVRTVLDFEVGGTDKDLDRVITACYTWGSAVMSLDEPVSPTVGGPAEPTVGGGPSIGLAPVLGGGAYTP
jgi:hypothetical protein